MLIGSNPESGLRIMVPTTMGCTRMAVTMTASVVVFWEWRARGRGIWEKRKGRGRWGGGFFETSADWTEVAMTAGRPCTIVYSFTCFLYFGISNLKY
jgi:hypothetical protein